MSGQLGIGVVSGAEQLLKEQNMADEVLREDEQGSETLAAMNEDRPRIFIDKESLGDKQCKPGDTITLKVTDVDPETGSVETEISGYSHKDGGDSEGYMADFDRAMPEEEGE